MITRGKEQVWSVGDMTGLKRAVRNVKDAKRNSSLLERLMCQP
jgi:ATP-dependent exoDNAse (exonuclease V) alpha subunit